MALGPRRIFSHPVSRLRRTSLENEAREQNKERSPPIVSVIIPTFNRPRELLRLLTAVSNQTLSDFECLAIDDGSTTDNVQIYRDIFKGFDARFIFREKPATERRTGPSASRNIGVELAKGHLVAFCDDDDNWICNDHLSEAVRAMSQHGADLFFADILASEPYDGQQSYYGPAMRHLTHVRAPSEADIYVVSKARMGDLISRRALHSDTIVAEKALVRAAGLYWEKTKHSEDLDFSFRATDKARAILFRTAPTAELMVAPHSSLVQGFTPSENALFSYLALFHAELLLESPTLRRSALKARAWRINELAKLALGSGDAGKATRLCIQSLLHYPTWTVLKLLFSSVVKRKA